MWVAHKALFCYEYWMKLSIIFFSFKRSFIHSSHFFFIFISLTLILLLMFLLSSICHSFRRRRRRQTIRDSLWNRKSSRSEAKQRRKPEAFSMSFIECVVGSDYGLISFMCTFNPKWFYELCALDSNHRRGNWAHFLQTLVMHSNEIGESIHCSFYTKTSRILEF